jgi:hypothetical protein
MLMGKQYIFLLMFILLAGCGAGCSENRYTDVGIDRGHALYIITDEETGCQYLTTGFKSSHSESTRMTRWGLTPRLGADGKIICIEVEK